MAEVFAEMKSRPSGDQLGEGPMAWNRLKKTDGNVMAGIWDFVCNILFFLRFCCFFHGRWQWLVWMLESTRCILIRIDPLSTNSLMLESLVYYIGTVEFNGFKP